MNYSIDFTKGYRDDYKKKKFQDRINDSIWFTRLSKGGPLFNYKYYLDNKLNVNKNVLIHDFLFINKQSMGGTIGVKWGILSDLNISNAPGLNPSLFSVLGVPESFYYFSQMCTLITTMMNNSNKPLALVDTIHNYAWKLENNDHSDNINMCYLKNVDLACYIPDSNEYFKIKITHLGNGEYDDPGYITYERTPLFTVSPPVIENVCTAINTVCSAIENAYTTTDDVCSVINTVCEALQNAATITESISTAFNESITEPVNESITESIVKPITKHVSFNVTEPITKTASVKTPNKKFKQIVNMVRAVSVIANKPKVTNVRTIMALNWKTMLNSKTKK